MSIYTSTFEPEEPSEEMLALGQLKEQIQLFHDEQRKPYLSICNEGVTQTYAIDSYDAYEYCQHWCVSNCDLYLSKRALNKFMERLKTEAKFSAECHPVFKRIGYSNNKNLSIYLDLCNAHGECVEINSQGWKILERSPVKFIRTLSMKPQVRPQKGGNINELFNFLNIPEDSKLLVLAWIIECFRLETPYPVLCLHGLKGSAKSMTQEFIKELIDPSTTNLRGAPKKNDDLMIAAINNHLISLNNLSKLSAKQQDEICCISTGGAFATRKLHTNQQESVANIKRPLLLNCIHEVIDAQDLIDRSIFINLPLILPKDRKTENEIRQAFLLQKPVLLGATLELLAKTLKHLPKVKLKEKPRMADFAVLGTALESALKYKAGTFMQIYNQKQKEMQLNALESHSIIHCLIDYIEKEQEYRGTFQELYIMLNENYKKFKYADWPSSVMTFATLLKRQQLALREIDIDIYVDPVRKTAGKFISISKLNNIKRLNNMKKNVHNLHVNRKSKNSR